MAAERIEIPAGELTFSALASGPDDGRLVLLLHGFPQAGSAWSQVMELLAQAGHRAVAPDQRGYSAGARPSEVEAYRMPHLVADVLAIADWLGGHRFDLVGHDWGGAVAWHVAGRYPDRVRSLAIASTPHPKAFRAAFHGDGDQAKRSSYMELFRQEGKAEDLLLADDAARLRALYAGSGLTEEESAPYLELLTDRAALTAALSWYRAMDAREADEMGSVTAPTLYAWGTEDVALGRAAAEATADLVVGPYRFEVLEGEGHWIPEKAGDRFGAFLLEHLAAS